MRKEKIYYLDKVTQTLHCDLQISGKCVAHFTRNLVSMSVESVCLTSDYTLFDVELHSFMRLSLQYHFNMIEPDKEFASGSFFEALQLDL